MAGALLLWAPIIFGQEISPTPQAADRSGVTVEEVIVTGSNIPTSEEVGPNPVDTYRREDIARLGVRTTTVLRFLPAGGNERGCCPSGGNLIPPTIQTRFPLAKV